jgi:hypothetical protein
MPFAEISFKFRRNFGIPEAGHALLPDDFVETQLLEQLCDDLMDAGA